MSEFFGDMITRYLEANAPAIEAWGARFGAACGALNEDAGHLVPPVFAEYVTATFPVSLDLLMDGGVIPDTRPRTGRKPPTRRERFRSAVSRHRLSVAEWFYRRISGEELPEEEW